jgi:hypothetical protein
MGVNYCFTFYDAEGKNIGGTSLERSYTHYPQPNREFWHDLCYTDKPKKEFAETFIEKIKTFDVSSETYQHLVSAFGFIVSQDGWCEAVIISVSC